MTGRNSRSQHLPSGKKSYDLHSMDSGAYDDESVKFNKTAVYHQSTSIETLAKYTISVLDPEPSIQLSPLVDNCLENLKIEAEKKHIIKQSKQPTESDKVLIVSDESSEEYHVQKGSANNGLQFNFHFNAPVSSISLDLHMKSLEKLCQSTNNNLPPIKLKVHSQHKVNSSGSPEDKNYKNHHVYMQESKSVSEASISDDQRNAKRKHEEDDEESNSSQSSRYSKMSKMRKSRSVGREKKTVENEETNASTSNDTAKRKTVSRKQCPNCRMAEIFDFRNRSKKKEVVKSKRKPKSRTKKNKISKSQRTLSQWVI